MKLELESIAVERSDGFFNAVIRIDKEIDDNSLSQTLIHKDIFVQKSAAEYVAERALNAYLCGTRGAFDNFYMEKS